MAVYLVYWTPICGKYFLEGCLLEKCGKIWKNGRFTGRPRPDWGNTTWVAMAGLGSIGLNVFLDDQVEATTTTRAVVKGRNGP